MKFLVFNINGHLLSVQDNERDAELAINFIEGAHHWRWVAKEVYIDMMQEFYSI